MARLFLIGTIMNVKSRLSGICKTVSLDFLDRGRVWGQIRASLFYAEFDSLGLLLLIY